MHQSKINKNFSSYFSVAISSVLWQKINFGKLAYIHWKAAKIIVINLYFVLQ